VLGAADCGEYHQAVGAAAPILTGNNVGGQNNFLLGPVLALEAPSKPLDGAGGRGKRVSC
jgi:hypothetical protein